MRSKSLLFGVSLALLAASRVAAQEVVQALPGTTDADALAADMRRLAANPRDVDALVDAAQLSVRLGDMRAAAALLARAENVDPRSGRVKAGQGSILVQSERPGEALRYFAQAERLGLAARAYVADRALAYDLIGEQERAQRDYRLALRDRPDDAETIRRYALSLGISGQRAPALALLDPLVRRSDRGAWRSQAFVLAMTGDVAGATRIATTMMPGGASGLSAFFARLPTLPATDRAFAVHFGEVRATPERLADARLAPPLSPLPRDSGAATMVAANTVPPAARRDRRETPPTQVAALPASGLGVRTQSPPAAAPAPDVPRTRAPVTLAAGTSPPAIARPAEVRWSATPVVPANVTPRPAPPAVDPVPAQVAPAATDTATAALAPTQAASLPATDIQPTPVRTTEIPPSTVAGPGAAQVAAVAPRALPPRPAADARMSEDSILARIVAGLSIPASELDIDPPARALPMMAAAPPPSAAPAAPRPDPAIAAARVDADRVAAEKLATARIAADKRAAAKTAADRRAADRKAVADRQALAEKKAAAEKKAIADKEAAEAKKLARTNPPRIWVQVAGGAEEGDLSKAWSAVKSKAPRVFGSRQPWTTPLRATNRVLAGPFRTDAEARAFVNDLKKQGVSAFTFTSDTGQPVKRLASR